LIQHGQIPQISDAIILANDIDKTKNELNELVNAYTLLASEQFEEVDIEVVLKKVKTLLAKRASEVGVQIVLDIQSEMPLAKGVSSRLEQILSNLVLNSIQQIEKKNKFWEQFLAKTQSLHNSKKIGLIMIQAKFNGLSNSWPIQIIVMDTGPGIHYQDQERIFMLDISTRQIGQGLGLFISRNLAESMSGRLRLIHSTIGYGSIFMVELSKA
jgi:signal transduction histidine kinase